MTDEIAVGLRMEVALMARVAQFNSNTGDGDISVSANGSYSLNGQYYLSNNRFRPFVGAGVGLFTVVNGAVSVSDDVATASSSVTERKGGFYPRVGFDFGHLNFIIDYNIIGKTTRAFDLVNGGITNVDTKNNYLSVKLGFSIGGGKS